MAGLPRERPTRETRDLERSTMAKRDFRRRYRDAGKRRAGGPPFHRRHRKLVVGVLSFVLLVVGAGASYAYLLNSKFGNIAKVKTEGIKNRPDPDKGKALNILLLGSDKGKAVPGASATTTLSEDTKAAKWPSGKYRSDTLMVVHISENRKHVYLVSIPRDPSATMYHTTGTPTFAPKITP